MRAEWFFLAVIAASAPLTAIEFVPNLGQMPSAYRYSARSQGLETIARVDGSVAVRSSSASAGGGITFSWRGANPGDWKPGPASAKQVRYCMKGLARQACAEGSPTYTSLRRPGLYDGVDLVLHSARGPLEYDLELQPGARVSDIQMEIQSDSLPVLEASGRMVAGGLVQWRPVAYQMIDGTRQTVRCSVRQISPRVFGFDVTGRRREDLPLIIDPVIEAGAVVTGSEPGDDRVLGTQANHTFGLSRRVGSTHSDVFVTDGSVTTYWGGDGEQQITGFDAESYNSVLTLVGWTSSTDAYTTGSIGQGTSFHGGASDGFFLEFFKGRLTQAAIVGGPGADRLNDVRRTAAVGYSGPYLIAGETDDPNWPGFKIDGQARGKTDAIAGWFGVSTGSLVMVGGSGADTAIVDPGSKWWLRRLACRR